MKVLITGAKGFVRKTAANFILYQRWKKQNKNCYNDRSSDDIDTENVC